MGAHVQGHVVQRYRALCGYEQRFQNGFDCQGLWVEVEVEKTLGFNSKREIESFGLERFARACRERVMHFADIQTEQSKRLGQWMDWSNSYFTMSDANIEYNWSFLQRCHERGWLYMGHRPMPWCTRCGTSISQHEMLDAYAELTHESVTVALPLLDRPDHRLLVWTTTPWTLPANVAVAVHPAARLRRMRAGGHGLLRRRRPRRALPALGQPRRTVKGAELVGLRYVGPFDDLPVQRGIEHRVIPWEDVLGRGRHRARPHRAGLRTRGLRARPPARASRYHAGGSRRTLPRWPGLPLGDGGPRLRRPDHPPAKERHLLFARAPYRHRYPTCWRCGQELIFRVADEWFLSAADIRPLARAANERVTWLPGYMQLRMDDWLANMGDWCISRKRYWGLPLPFYLCGCGRLTVVGSRGELRELAMDPTAVDAVPELHRPWLDDILIRCPDCAQPVRRIPEVGDCWLDAGIVPFSTLGWHNTSPGYATGAALGLTTADLPDHAYWEKWFPADWISEMREQIRLWFYSQLFMSVALEGRAPSRVLGYEKLLDERGRAMHRSWGNAITVDDAIQRWVPT